MSTIASVSVPVDYVAPRSSDVAYRVVTRRAYSIDGYDPVVVTIKVGTTDATVQVTCVGHGFNYRRHPTTEQMRRLVDEALPTGVRRDGRVEGVGNGWFWRYPITTP